MIHLNWSLLESVLFYFIHLNVSLIPLERVKSLLDMRNEAILHIVVNSHVAFNQVTESFNHLIRILV